MMELLSNYNSLKFTIKEARIQAGYSVDEVCSILDIPCGLLEAYEKYYYAMHPVVAAELARMYNIPLSSINFN